jgi:hypothetical protein
MANKNGTNIQSGKYFDGQRWVMLPAGVNFNTETRKFVDDNGTPVEYNPNSPKDAAKK